MPKIPPIKEHNDSSFQAQSIPRRKFSKVKEDAPQPIIRENQMPINDLVVPIYEVSYDPQFSKSPLASVEMSRREKVDGYNRVIPPQLYEEEEKRHVVKREEWRQEDSKNCDWKSILCWTGIIVGMILLLVGLYFLVDLIMGKGSSRQNKETHNQNNPSVNGISPIYVNPIPYNRIESSSSSTTASKTPIAQTKQRNTNGGAFQQSTIGAVTSPSVLLQLSNELLNQNKKPAPIKPYPSNSGTYTQKKILPQSVQPLFGIDPLQNSIEPLNAYQTSPT